jgi:c-di-GMP-binding flagellar brake protein YcgR
MGFCAWEQFEIAIGEGIVPPHIAETRQNLRKLIDFLISRKREITVQIEGNRTLYTSMIISADYGDLLSKMSDDSKLIIEMLVPGSGNSLLKMSPNVEIQFLLGEKSCQFDSRYLGVSTEYPHIGQIISFPESVKLVDRRGYERDSGKIPAFLYGILVLRKGTEGSATYELEIINRSAYGIGMLVMKNDFGLLEILKEGDELQDLELYSPTAVVKVTGSVRHKTKLQDKKYEGSYVLGIKLDETLEDLPLA